MDDEYLIPAGEAGLKIVVKSSRFISRAAFTPTVHKAMEFIQKVKHEESGHSHAVYAYVIGYGNTVVHGMSDAGEPTGTAGRPVLEVLKGSNIGDITMVVIRFFGGTKLGTGGLVRAYTRSARETLELLKLIKKTKKICIEISFSYEHYNAFKTIITRYNGQILEKQFSTNVFCRVMIPEKSYADVTAGLKNVCAGKVEINEVNDGRVE